MKTNIKSGRIILTVIAFCSCLCSCSRKEVAISEDCMAYGLKTEVDSIRVRSYKAVRMGGKASKGSPVGGPADNFSVIFDGGNAIERRGYDTGDRLIEDVVWSWSKDKSEKFETHTMPQWGNASMVYTYKYSVGKEVGGTISDQDGNSVASWKNKFDGTGIKETVYFDHEGNRNVSILKKHNSTGWVTKAETYDAEGNLTETAEYDYDNDGRLTEHESSTGWEMEAEYNAQGLVSKVRNGHGNLWSEKNDGTWNCLRSDACTGEVITREYEYEYDKKGNWVTRTVSINGIVVEINERAIYY